MNTVDVIFPAWPAFLYLNPELGKLLLLPLFDYQMTGLYPNKWSIHDMGRSYECYIDQTPISKLVRYTLSECYWT